jgi:hypothetical protein
MRRLLAGASYRDLHAEVKPLRGTMQRIPTLRHGTMGACASACAQTRGLTLPRAGLAPPPSLSHRSSGRPDEMVRAMPWTNRVAPADCDQPRPTAGSRCAHAHLPTATAHRVDRPRCRTASDARPRGAPRRKRGLCATNRSASTATVRIARAPMACSAHTFFGIRNNLVTMNLTYQFHGVYYPSADSNFACRTNPPLSKGA